VHVEDVHTLTNGVLCVTVTLSTSALLTQYLPEPVVD